MQQQDRSYTTAEVDALTDRASVLMDQLRAVFSEIRLAVVEIVGEGAADAVTRELTRGLTGEPAPEAGIEPEGPVPPGLERGGADRQGGAGDGGTDAGGRGHGGAAAEGSG